MRSASYFKRWVCLLTLGLAIGLSGCEEQALDADLFGATATEPTPEADPADKLAAEVQSQVQRVSGIAETQQPPAPPREVLWLKTTGETMTTAPADPPQVTAHTPPPTADIITVSQPADPPASVVKQDASQTPTPDDTEQLTRSQVYTQLLDAVRKTDDSNLSKALTAATLGAINPHGEMDWSLLAQLSPKDKDLVERYHKTVSALRKEVLMGGGTIDQNKVEGRLDELFGQRPVAIRHIQLCEKVLGYGVYDAFPDNRFVAGRPQKLIVYVELDNFQPVAREEGDGYEVKLRQELELYESNGFEVWSHEPVLISDVSMNKRRDFFIVQLVTLPGQLGLGQYHLKVRVYDENAGTRDESSIEIQLVADKSLVRDTNR